MKFFALIFINVLVFAHCEAQYNTKTRMLQKPDSNFSGRLMIIAPDYTIKKLGYMCQKEWQFEKATKIPLRIRIGAIDDCDRLEGKKLY